MLKRSFLIILLICFIGIAFVLTGCRIVGGRIETGQLDAVSFSTKADPAVFEAILPPEGMSLVYVYRRASLARGGVLLKVSIDGAPEVTLPNAGYMTFIVEPGEHLVRTRIGFETRFMKERDNTFQRELTITSEPDERYFIKGRVKRGLVHPRVRLRVRDEVDALSDLVGLQRVTDKSIEMMGSPPVVTDHAMLDHYVGDIITIRGEVSNTKLATCIGVDVKSDHPDLRGSAGMATGRLEKWIVTQEELDRQIREHGIFANRGPGTFYTLIVPSTNKIAHVRPVPNE